MNASDLRRGDTFPFNGWTYTVLNVNPPDQKRGLARLVCASPVDTVELFEMYEDMTRYVSIGDKVK